MVSIMESMISRRATRACSSASAMICCDRPLNLNVHLHGRDAFGGAGDFEVHVADMIFQALDIGQNGVFFAVSDHAHGDTGNRPFDRHTAVHQRQCGGADTGLAGAAVGGEHLGYDANRVGELFFRGDHGQQSFLSQGAVANLPPLWAAQEPGLAGGEGREVVMMHVAAAVLGIKPF